MVDVPIEVRVARSTDDLDAVRQLLRAFVGWHRTQHREDLHLVDAYFDPIAFEAELAGLPGPYAEPAGLLLLAWRDRTPAGCVALKPVDEEICEMKRMFVPPELQGVGVGWALGRAIVEGGRSAGYQRMRLDTSFRQEAAMGLYRRLGFTRVDPDPTLPEDLQHWLVYFELRL